MNLSYQTWSHCALCLIGKSQCCLFCCGIFLHAMMFFFVLQQCACVIPWCCQLHCMPQHWQLIFALCGSIFLWTAALAAALLLMPWHFSLCCGIVHLATALHVDHVFLHAVALVTAFYVIWMHFSVCCGIGNCVSCHSIADCICLCAVVFFFPPEHFASCHSILLNAGWVSVATFPSKNGGK